MTIKELETLISEDVGLVTKNGSLSGAAKESLIKTAKRYAREELAKLKDKADGFLILGVAHIDEAINSLE